MLDVKIRYYMNWRSSRGEKVQIIGYLAGASGCQTHLHVAPICASRAQEAPVSHLSACDSLSFLNYMLTTY